MASYRRPPNHRNLDGTIPEAIPNANRGMREGKNGTNRVEGSRSRTSERKTILLAQGSHNPRRNHGLHGLRGCFPCTKFRRLGSRRRGNFQRRVAEDAKVRREAPPALPAFRLRTPRSAVGAPEPAAPPRAEKMLNKGAAGGYDVSAVPVPGLPSGKTLVRQRLRQCFVFLPDRGLALFWLWS